jgi:hypothetical protein
MSETRSLVSFGPIANLAESAGNQASILSFLQIRRTPIAPRPASMLGLQVVQGGLGTNQVNYLYNGLGQRVSKQGPTALVPTGTHLYTFDEAGHLIGERAGCGNLNTAISEKAAPMGEDRARKDWSGNEQKTPTQPLCDLQGEGGG